MSTPRQREYSERGYVVVNDLLPEEDFRELDRMADRLLDGELRPELPYKGKLPDDFYTFWEPGMKDRTDLQRRSRVRLMSYMCWHHPYFYEFVRCPEICDVVAEVLDGGAQIFSDTVFMKPPRHGIEAAPHQDTAFWPKLSPNALNFWMAIDPATVENGCLHVIPESHHNDLPHHKHPVQGWLLRDEEIDLSRQVPVELPPNAAIFFDSGLIHRSYPNRSDRSRRSMALVYGAGNLTHVQPWDNNYEFEQIDRQRQPAAAAAR
jgi:phytanoyl-CoA hydroxylase